MQIPGWSSRAWISAERLRLAGALLLENDEGIEAVASQCGYTSLPSFSRLFTRQFGCSPLVWRERADGRAERRSG
jgi:transcriptional regulator GlxA family with amidase domain